MGELRPLRFCIQIFPLLANTYITVTNNSTSENIRILNVKTCNVNWIPDLKGL